MRVGKVGEPPFEPRGERPAASRLRNAREPFKTSVLAFGRSGIPPPKRRLTVRDDGGGVVQNYVAELRSVGGPACALLEPDEALELRRLFSGALGLMPVARGVAPRGCCRDCRKSCRSSPFANDGSRRHGAFPFSLAASGEAGGASVSAGSRGSR